MSRPAPFVVVGDLAGASAGVRFGLDAGEHHHLRRVLRVGDGAPVVATDGNGRSAPAVVRGDDIELVDVVTTVVRPRPRVTVWQALPKGRKVDDVARVLTELAVDELVIVAARRSVADRADRAEKMQARLDAVMRAAARQSRNPHAPRIRGPVTVSDLSTADGACVLIAEPAADTALDATVLAADALPDDVVVAIGPEGGWDEAEREHLQALGGRLVRLGDTILRTEHAAAAAVAAISALTSRWRQQPAGA